MSSCLSGGSRPYGLDLEIIKSPSTSTWTSHSSSPSSTLSESSNSPIAISTRKPRTPRKRPNQTYNEAAALLSTAYPKIFSTKQLTKPCKFTKPHSPFSYEHSDLLLPFQMVENPMPLLRQSIIEKPHFRTEPKFVSSCGRPCPSPGENDSRGNSLDMCDGFQEDFDAESILDEEIEQGIDSIMGNLSVNSDSMDESKASCYGAQSHTCNGFPMGLGFGGTMDFGFGMREGVKAFRNADEGDWWRFPTVDVLSITPKFNKISAEKKKKKKKKVEKPVELKCSESAKENPISWASEENSVPMEPREDSIPRPNSGLLLKLNYEEVLNAWSDRGSPFPEEIPGSESSGNDIHARLAQIDLFSDSGGVREASVLRYKEKRRTRLFSKKIRYQVRKVNADRRPRMKGRFVRRSNSPFSEQ